MFNRPFLLGLCLFASTTNLVLADNTPSQAYMNIHNIEVASKSYADILPYRTKASVASDKPISEEQKKQMFDLFKVVLVKEVFVKGEEISGDSAILTVEGAPSKDLKPGDQETTTGKIYMVMEDGQWKLDKEEWKSHCEIH